MSIMLIIEKKPREGFRKLAFEKKGLCISRFHPEYLRTKYLLENVELYWLSEIRGKKAIKPDGIEEILNTISKYTKKNKDCTVLFDGVEYLLLYNTAQRITELLKKIEELSINHGFTFIIHLDPDVLSACPELYEIFAPYFTLHQEKELRRIFQVELDHEVQIEEDR